jgi:formate dehydrogenase subunit delta
MDPARLVYLANQIAKFFHAQGEAAAQAGVEDHLRKFWDPRMRREIVAHLDAGGAGLLPAARAAVARLAEGQGGASPP